MNVSFVVSFFQEAITIAGMLSLPTMMLGLVVGLMVSIFQAVTQINEQTLAIIPKILAIASALLVFGGWMLQHMVRYTIKVFDQIVSLPG